MKPPSFRFTSTAHSSAFDGETFLPVGWMRARYIVCAFFMRIAGVSRFRDESMKLKLEGCVEYLQQWLKTNTIMYASNHFSYEYRLRSYIHHEKSCDDQWGLQPIACAYIERNPLQNLGYAGDYSHNKRPWLDQSLTLWTKSPPVLNPRLETGNLRGVIVQSLNEPLHKNIERHNAERLRSEFQAPNSAAGSRFRDGILGSSSGSVQSEIMVHVGFMSAAMGQRSLAKVDLKNQSILKRPKQSKKITSTVTMTGTRWTPIHAVADATMTTLAYMHILELMVAAYGTRQAWYIHSYAEGVDLGKRSGASVPKEPWYCRANACPLYFSPVAYYLRLGGWYFVQIPASVIFACKIFAPPGASYKALHLIATFDYGDEKDLMESFAMRAIKALSFSTIPVERTNAAADTNIGNSGSNDIPWTLRLLSAEELSQRCIVHTRYSVW
ncbi:hypothetical protein ARMGADRAFT_1022963 [Armillaria gallica]|uniref:Uncharacterized protein n=1 Tax=Armillaria gallica TaxID=47427 RepID=A0A2H3EAZ1_ARMGA|nr:hypothetical protein ARMGADRAFT_1022963 [Armillaria gallica]